MGSPEKYLIRTLGEYQRSMEVFETSQDPLTLPDVRLVLRGDAHRFGPSWNDEPDAEYPFGTKFIGALTETAKIMMACGLKTVFAYMHGDEVSLLLDESESNNARRKSRLISLASSTASLAFLQAFGKPAVFHTRLAELPNDSRVLDYFFWQRKVAQRNFLSRTLGLLLADSGRSESEAAATLKALDENGRRELLVQLGRPPSTVSAYEQFGLALWWENKKTQDGDKPTLQLESRLPASDDEYLTLLNGRLFGSGFACAESLDEVRVSDAPPARTSRGPREQTSAEAQRPSPPSNSPAKREPFRITSRGIRGPSS